MSIALFTAWLVGATSPIWGRWVISYQEKRQWKRMFYQMPDGVEFVESMSIHGEGQ